MNIIGITGNSGSGKTTISEIIEKETIAKIIDADKVAKKLTNEESKYLQAIVETFGDKILLEDGKLNRQELAKTIYNDDQAREKLNKLTFEHVVNEIKRELNQAKMKKIYNVIVLDVPLLFESNLNEECDIVIGVVAPENEKIKRICIRDGINETQAIERLKVQLDEKYYKENCEYIIENIDYERTREQVVKILKKLQ